MPKNDTVSLAAKTWTEITNADVTRITVQNTSGDQVYVLAATVQPAAGNTSGALRLNPGQVIVNEFLADLFPGLTDMRVWVNAPSGGSVMVSHS